MVPLFFLSCIANFFKTAVFTHYLPFFTFSAPKSICYFFTESTKNSHWLVTILLGFLAISDLGDSLFLNYSFFYQLHNITGREKKKLPTSLTNSTLSPWLLLILYTIKLHVYWLLVYFLYPLLKRCSMKPPLLTTITTMLQKSA